jgi:DNA-directed RNA polymerase specialized sigma24 family protein
MISSTPLPERFPLSFQGSPAMSDSVSTGLRVNRESLEALLLEARNGNPEAAQRLFDKYAKHFLTVIRHRLAPRVRSVFDSDDFLQETRMALFANRLHEDCTSVESFVAFLTRVAENKVLAANRKFLDYRRRSLKREVSLAGIPDEQIPAAPRCSPAVAALANDEWESLLKDRPLVYRKILEKLRQGFTHCEIATALQINERFVRRVLVKIQAEKKGSESIN